MASGDRSLKVKRSRLPESGKGLFAGRFISKGTDIVEYKGKISSWKDADQSEGKNGYLFYVNRNHVIDARKYRKALARYANDARGVARIKGVANNAAYTQKGAQIFITATKDIPAGSEILVGYGKEYWDMIKMDKKR